MPGYWRADGSYSDGSSDVQLTGSSAVQIKDSIGNNFLNIASYSGDNVSINSGFPVGTYGYNGASYDRLRCAKVNKYLGISMPGSAGTTSVWTPAAGKKFRLLGFILSADIAGTYTLLDNGVNIIKIPLAANTPVAITLPSNGILSTAANNPLQASYPAITGNLFVTAIGTEE